MKTNGDSQDEYTIQRTLIEAIRWRTFNPTTKLFVVIVANAAGLSIRSTK